MIIYLSGGAHGKEAAETMVSIKHPKIGCLLSFRPRIEKILLEAFKEMRKAK